jgi:hypothetical protein
MIIGQTQQQTSTHASYGAGMSPFMVAMIGLQLNNTPAQADTDQTDWSVYY